MPVSFAKTGPRALRGSRPAFLGDLNHGRSFAVVILETLNAYFPATGC
jgi:hypothetical protein